MKTYQITYYLGDIYRLRLVDANNEAEAINTALNELHDGSKAIMHDFEIERFNSIYPED